MPLQFPTAPLPAKVRVTPRTVSVRFDNPYTGQHQEQILSNARRLDIEVTMQPMLKAQAAVWAQFIYDLQGTAGTFYFDPSKWCAGIAVATGDRVYRMASPDVGWDAEYAYTFGISFSAVEVI